MRVFGKLAAVTIVACLAVQLVGGQQPGGLGSLLGGLQQDPAVLLRNNDVKKELKVTPEQEAKLAAAYLEALAKVLDPDQLKRLKQISLQSRDYTAFADPSIQDDLKLNDDQKKDIKTIMADADKKKEAIQAEAPGGKGKGGFGGFGGLGGNQQKIQALNKETMENCKEVLTAEQRRLWTEMLGDEFTFTAGGALGGFDLKGLDLKGLDLKNFDPAAIQDLLKKFKKGG